MARLPTTRHNLHRAFHKHKACYEALRNDFDQSRRLILFYAVETGLKIFLMDRMLKGSVDSLISHQEYQYLYKNGHDIKWMLKKASMDSQFTLKAVKCKKNIYAEPQQFHEVWRYGLEIANDDDEQTIESTMRDIIEHLSQRISSTRTRKRS